MGLSPCPDSLVFQWIKRDGILHQEIIWRHLYLTTHPDWASFLLRLESLKLSRGVHPPEAMMYFPLCFRFLPLFSKISFTFWKISKISPFPEKISHFHPPKFLTSFFSHQPQISDFPPILPVLEHFPSDSRKCIISPLFPKFPRFQKI